MQSLPNRTLVLRLYIHLYRRVHRVHVLSGDLPGETTQVNLYIKKTIRTKWTNGELEEGMLQEHLLPLMCVSCKTSWCQLLSVCSSAASPPSDRTMCCCIISCRLCSHSRAMIRADWLKRHRSGSCVKSWWWKSGGTWRCNLNDWAKKKT